MYYLEMIHRRPLQVTARQLISHAITGEIQLIAPCLFLDEITEVFCGKLDDLQKVQQHLLYLEQNDSKHVAKVNRFGHLEKLTDYQKVFERISDAKP